jgi:DNA polymerase
MDRREAVLRELNLYPLWKRRGEPAPAEERDEAADAVAPPAAGPVVEPSLHPSGTSGAGIPAAATPAAPAEGADPGREQRIAGLGWPELKTMVRDCTACKLRAGCTQTVFGVGDEKADWLFVGEGPGAEEDAQGEPFVGQAGKLLDNMLAAIGLKRGSNVYIANIVKCRPPGNRTPEADEIATCMPYLRRQIRLIQPRLIVALGKTAAVSLLGRDATLGSLRGTLHEYRLAPAAGPDGDQGGESSRLPPLAAVPLIVTYHPAYLLRTPSEKAKAWEDLCMAVRTFAAGEQA